MRIVTNYLEFAEEVKMIDDWWRLRDMGLTCRTSIMGAFLRSETDDMRDFCEHNPQFHIVSFCPDGFVWNRFHPEANAYYLAEGNADPHLVLDFRIEVEESLEELFGGGFSLSEPDE